MNDFIIAKFRCMMRRRKWENLPCSLSETQKNNICIMETIALNMPFFRSIVEQSFLTTFCSLDFLSLPCGALNFNVCKTKHHLINLFRKKSMLYLQNNAPIFIENIQKWIWFTQFLAEKFVPQIISSFKVLSIHILS